MEVVKRAYESIQKLIDNAEISIFHLYSIELSQKLNLNKGSFNYFLSCLINNLPKHCN